MHFNIDDFQRKAELNAETIKDKLKLSGTEGESRRRNIIEPALRKGISEETAQAMLDSALVTLGGKLISESQGISPISKDPGEELESLRKQLAAQFDKVLRKKESQISETHPDAPAASIEANHWTNSMSSPVRSQ